MHAWLRQWIYSNQTPFDFAFPPVRAACEVAVVFVIVLLSSDLASAPGKKLNTTQAGSGASRCIVKNGAYLQQATTCRSRRAIVN
jgi:hypothetical protein